MSTTETFTGKMHAHEPVVLAVRSRKQALRLSAMLEAIEDHPEPVGLIMLVRAEGVSRIVVCRGCLEIARQNLIAAADVISDLIAHPTIDEEQRTHGQRK